MSNRAHRVAEKSAEYSLIGDPKSNAALVAVPLGEAVNPTRPRVKPSEHPELPFIGMEHVEAHTMKLLGTVRSGTMKSSSVHFQPGDVLYGRLRPYLNKVYRPTFEGLCSAEFIVFPENDRVHSSYLQYFLNSSAFVRYASHLNAGDRPRVDFDQLASYFIPLPSKAVQTCIVAEIEKQFSRLDEAIANLKRVKANLKRYKAAVLKAAVEGRLVKTEAELARREGRSYETGGQLLQRILETRRSQWKGKGKYKEPAAPDTTDLPELPGGWVWVTTGQLCDCIVPNRDKPKSFGGSIPWLTLPDFEEDLILIVNSRANLGLTSCEVAEFGAKVVPRDSVVMSCVGRFGITAVLSRDAVINQQLHAFLPSRNVLPPYMAYALKTRVNEMEAASTATTISYLNKEKCNGIHLPIPSVPEQERIVAEVERRLSFVRETASQVEANLKRAERLRQSVLAEAFSGKLSRQEAGLGVAA